MIWFSAEPESAKPAPATCAETALSTQHRPETLTDVSAAMRTLGADARRATRALAHAKTEAKNAALIAAAGEIREQTAAILLANERDLNAARPAGVSAAFL